MRTKFIIIVLLQVALLAGIIGYRHYWVATGAKIVLKTVPVDPRDIFRGEYVHLNYEITNMNLESLKSHEKFFPGDKVFVSLEENSDGITWSPSGVGKTPAAGATYIQGRVNYESVTTRWNLTIRDDAGHARTFEQQWIGDVKQGDRIVACLDSQDRFVYLYRDDPARKQNCGPNVSLPGMVEALHETKFRQLSASYGIEDYFVEEGKGLVIERSQGPKVITVEVSLRPDGKGIISRLLVNGRPYSNN